MANLAKWTSLSTAITIADNAALASRANGYFSIAQVAGADVVIDNATNKNLYLALDLKLGAAAWGIGGWFEFYLIESLDGAAYDNGSTTVLPAADNLVASLGTHGNSTALSSQAIQLSRPGIVIPPSRFKLLWRNQSGVATAATGNSLTAYTYNLDLNG